MKYCCEKFKEVVRRNDDIGDDSMEKDVNEDGSDSEYYIFTRRGHIGPEIHCCPWCGSCLSKESDDREA